MNRLRCTLAAAWLMASSTPLVAQVSPLLPEPRDSRLWESPQVEVASPSVGLQSPLLRRGTTFGGDLFAGYLVGAALGLGLGEKAAPPREMGLWLRGWYRGSLMPDPPRALAPDYGGYRLGLVTGSRQGDDGFFAGGLVRGFLDALAVAADN